MAKAKKGYFGSTEPQARKVLEQIQSTRKKKKKVTPKSKQRKIYEQNNKK